MSITAERPTAIRSLMHIFSVLLCATTGVALVQAPRVELDHVFIVVSPGAATEIAALQRAGLTVDTKITRHPEDGTVSVAALFENAYLELIWVDAAGSVTPEHAATAAWFRSAAAWRTSAHSPFGLGLRRVSGDTAPLPVPVQRETAPWLGPDAAYEVLRRSDETRASDFFVVPSRAAVASWIHRVRRDSPALLKHPGGGREITRVVQYGPVAQEPHAFQRLRPARLAFVRAAEPRVEVQLDGAAQDRRTDLRPALPLVIVR
jgi:hypothetical protein